jgi:hypothetical protein
MSGDIYTAFVLVTYCLFVAFGINDRTWERCEVERENDKLRDDNAKLRDDNEALKRGQTWSSAMLKHCLEKDERVLGYCASALVNLAYAANGRRSSTIDLEQVTLLGEPVGDWEIVVFPVREAPATQ